MAIVRVPFRSGFSLASPGEVNNRALKVISQLPSERWVGSGHSKGAFYAVEFAFLQPDRTEALVLVGSAHPRERDLSASAIPVTKIYGTRDGVATQVRIRASAQNLPATTRWVLIHGGNHSQFGYYGFQPGDWPASISRHDQQDVVRRELLRRLAAQEAPDSR